jgi:glycine oxidase
MLAPGVEQAEGAAHDFARLARDRYPGYVAALRARTGVEVALDRSGVLQVALADEHADERAIVRADALRGSVRGDARWLDAAELSALEPSLAPAHGAVLHPDDGAVDNRALLAALVALTADHPRIARLDRAAALESGGGPAAVRAADGLRHEAALVVVAAGAWSPALAGLPRALPVEPVRGQILALAATPLRHVVYGHGGYLVPRGDRTLVGSTMERVGFTVETTAAAIATLRAAGEAMCPALVGAAEVARWAGLRPVTPDGLPILGRDPEHPTLLYATGHSRNGVLLAPLTGECVAALAAGLAPPADLRPFAVERFAATAPRDR